MVFFTLVGMRIELDFFEVHVESSSFKGTEDVEVDPALLFRLIRHHWAD